MSALKPEDIVFSLKKPYLLVYSNAPIYLGRPFGYEQADSRERPALFLTKKKQFLGTEECKRQRRTISNVHRLIQESPNNLLA